MTFIEQRIEAIVGASESPQELLNPVVELNGTLFVDEPPKDEKISINYSANKK